MPVAIGADALVAIAFALVAIGGVLLVRQVIISPMQGAAVAVSGTPLIGGVIAWALSHAAQLIEFAVTDLVNAQNAAKAQGVSALQWFVATAWSWAFAGWVAPISWIVQYFAPVQTAVLQFTRIWDDMYWMVIPMVNAAQADLAGLHQWIDAVELPFIRGIGDDLAGLHKWIDAVELPFIRGIGDDLAGLHKWLDEVLVPGIDAQVRQLGSDLARTNADVQTRALESEAKILRDRVSQLEKSVATLSALGILAIAGTEAIENLRCLANTPCNPLDQLLNGDLDARITELEIGNG